LFCPRLARRHARHYPYSIVDKTVQDNNPAICFDLLDTRSIEEPLCQSSVSPSIGRPPRPMSCRRVRRGLEGDDIQLVVDRRLGDAFQAA